MEMAVGFLLAAILTAAAANCASKRSSHRWALTVLVLMPMLLMMTMMLQRPLLRGRLRARLFSFANVRTPNLRRWDSLQLRVVPGSGASYPSVVPPDDGDDDGDGRVRWVTPMVMLVMLIMLMVRC